jgi:hypothetical protein
MDSKLCRFADCAFRHFVIASRPISILPVLVTGYLKITAGQEGEIDLEVARRPIRHRANIEDRD